jgi:hypothetical protein
MTERERESTGKTDGAEDMDEQLLPRAQCAATTKGASLATVLLFLLVFAE